MNTTVEILVLFVFFSRVFYVHERLLYYFIEKNFYRTSDGGGGVGWNRTGGGRGDPKRPNFTGRPLWMAPKFPLTHKV